MKRVALYCRVSTDIQEKGETIENQLRDLQRIYSDKEIVKTYIDNPASGGDLDRKGLSELRADAPKGLFDIVGIWDSSRLTRDVKSALILRDEFKENGIQIEVMGKERDDSEAGKLFSVLEATMDELERERIKRRFMAGKKRRLSEGKMIGCYPPYGYVHVKRDKDKNKDAYFKINQSEALIVKKIFSLYLELESIFMVAKKLSEMGIKSRGKNGQPKFFHTSTIKKILGNENYIGNWYYGKTTPCLAKFHISKERKHKLTGRKINPKSEWQMIKIPVIIDKITFNRAQQILKKRYKQKGAESKFPVLCKGLIRCVDCGRLYGAKLYKYNQNPTRGKKQYLIYRCPQISRLDFNQPACHSKSMICHKLDSIVWDYVSNLIQDKERIKANINLLKEKRDKDRISNQKVYDVLLLEKKELKIKISKLLDLYSDNELAKDDLKSKIDELKEKEEILDNQIRDIKGEFKKIDNMEAIEEEVEKLCIMYNNNIHTANFEQKRYIVKKWVKEINLLKDGKILIKVNLPEIELPTTLSLCPMTTYLAQRGKEVKWILESLKIK